MRKKTFLLSGLLLMGVFAFAQNGPDLNNPKSAKVVFSQDFEQDWDEFSQTEIDQISQLEYYSNTGSNNGTSLAPWNNPEDWQRGLFRTDTVIPIYNGNMIVIEDYESMKGQEIWGDNDPSHWTIVDDDSDEEAERKAQFSAYGEWDEGGDRYFRFISDTILMNYTSGAYSNKLAARYRRNLFVHLKPGDIEENSSYRLTFYVKAKTLPGHEGYVATPTVYADVLRGYYHAEKPFSMGYVANSSSHPYEYNKTFEYTKNDFYQDKDWDNWEKVTFMTYYTTDSIADRFFYSDGYWWAENGDWLWKGDAPDNPTGNDLRYIVQPDKFMVRLGFPADYTEYCVDNISLSKSWIGGCEYYGDKMRVDFGYETNLSQLVKEEKDRTGMNLLEISRNYFQVWCLQKGFDESDPSGWFQMPMRSAEYHSDGYMYLFTDFFTYEGEVFSYEFSDFAKVLVSFQNPIEDPRLTLRYTGMTFPQANNIEWIQDGKIVPDFVNEIAVPNPSPMNWEGVYSKYDLPPVLLEAPYEDGSFGLEPVNEMKFKFSRKVLFDNYELSEKAIAYVNDERWNLSYDPENDSILIISSPNGQYLAEGDYVIELSQLQGLGTDYGNNVVVHYNFGYINRILSGLTITPVWNARFYDTEINYGNAQLQPAGTAASYSAYSWATSIKLEIGDGVKKNNAARLYFYTSPETNYPRLLCLSPRGSSSTPASLYLGYGENFEINLNTGSYMVGFDAASLNTPLWIKAYVYPWNESPHLIDVADKQLIGEYTFGTSFPESLRNDETSILDDLLTPVIFGFSIHEQGEYIVEIQVEAGGTVNGGYACVLLSDITISSTPLQYSPIAALNASVEAAAECISLAQSNVELYGGSTLSTLINKHVYYAIGGGFEAEHKTKPSEWAAAKNDLDNYSRLMKNRMETVDALQAKIADATEMYYNLDDVNKYLESAILLNSLINTATDNGLFPITEKSDSEIYSLISRIDAAMTETSVRVEKNERLSQYMSDAQELIDVGIRRDYDEYYILSNVLGEAMALDMIQATDDEVDAECEQLFRAIKLYDAKVSGCQAMTARIKSLRTLAQELGSDIVYNSSLNQIVDNLQTDDDEIAEIYKTAIMIEIYRYLMDDPYAFEDGLDITPFIKNYNLYVTNYEPYVDNRDLTLGTGSDRNSERAKGYNNPGSSIMWIGHYYGQDYLDNKIWVLMYDTEYSNVFPGWTVQSFASGFGMASPDPTASEYDYLRYGAPQFDGSLVLDWNSKAELKTTIEGIPNGCYSLGVKAEIDASSSARSTIKSITKVYGYDSIICNEITYDYNGTIMLDNIPVLDGEMNIELSLQSNDGFTKVDDFSLIFYGDYYYADYGDKINELEAKLNYMLNGYSDVDNYCIYMDDVSCEAGSQVVIPINLQNSNDVTAFSLDVRLPSGITFASANLASGRANGHSLSSNISNQWSYSTVSLACMSTENNALIGYDGTVVYLTVNVSSDIEGDFSILLDNIEVTSLPIMKQNPYSYTGTVSVSAYVMPGDVYVDGSITITDAVGIVAFIINSNTQGLNRRAADANQDGVIDVSDVVWVINKVIHKSYAPRRGPAATVIPATLTLDYSVTGNKMSIPVRIEGIQNEITAAQFNMTLPEGISLSGVTTDNYHMVFIQKQEDGTYMIACISLNNSTFSAAEEAALTLDFEFSKLLDGEEVLLNNIILATPDGHKTYIDNVICRLSSEGGQTGIRGIGTDNDSEMFDLQGRAIDKANGIYIRNGQKRIQIK